MTNIQRIRDAIQNLDIVHSDLQEKLDMIQAEETHGAEWADQGEPYANAVAKLLGIIEDLEEVEELV